MKLSKKQIEVLKQNFSKIKTVNLESPTIADISVLINKLSIPALVDLMKAKINWVSDIASIKLVQRGWRRPEQKTKWKPIIEAPTNGTEIIVLSQGKEIKAIPHDSEWHGQVWIQRKNGQQIYNIEGFQYI